MNHAYAISQPSVAPIHSAQGVARGLATGVRVGMALAGLYAVGAMASQLGYYDAANALLSSTAACIVAASTLIVRLLIAGRARRG